MPSDVQFTRAQKWDLVRLSAAAVASTVFFTVPMFLVHPRQTASQVDDRRPVAARVPTSGVTDGSPSGMAPSTTLLKSSPEAADVSVVTSMQFVLATAPPIQPAAPAIRTRSRNPAQLRARANTAPPNSSTSSFGRRVARFFAGTGKYDVKPFPTVTTSGS
jgi:hypothetical protein